MTKKYGNKELLLDLIDAEILPQYGNAPFIASWSIVYVNGSYTSDGYTQPSEPRIYAVHKTEGDIIDLYDFIHADSAGSDFADKGYYREVYKENYLDPENVISSRTIHRR